MTVSVGLPAAEPTVTPTPPEPTPGCTMSRIGCIFGHVVPPNFTVTASPDDVGSPASAIPVASGSTRYGIIMASLSCTTYFPAGSGMPRTNWSSEPAGRPGASSLTAIRMPGAGIFLVGSAGSGTITSVNAPAARAPSASNRCLAAVRSGLSAPMAASKWPWQLGEVLPCLGRGDMPLAAAQGLALAVAARDQTGQRLAGGQGTAWHEEGSGQRVKPPVGHRRGDQARVAQCRVNAVAGQVHGADPPLIAMAEAQPRQRAFLDGHCDAQWVRRTTSGSAPVRCTPYRCCRW